ncbi:hypothetical protein [Dyadobacter bucti]|uniref:hypothetical protein n=1 Tax=Dyadobacter bucti TaxID=2572203 RepID=UPI00110926E6|nr:hypothetical protein [Dyadobacter bucti]
MVNYGFAKRIADALGVTLDYLVGEGQSASLDKKIIQRLQAIEQLPEDEKKPFLPCWMPLSGILELTAIRGIRPQYRSLIPQ